MVGTEEASRRRRVRLEPQRIGDRVDVLVLGAAGLVGSHIRAALGRGHVVATYHRVEVPDAIPLDITDAEAVRRLMARVRPAAVVIAAAEAHVERCEREPEATRRLNVEAARTVIEEAAALGATVVVFASEYVFDGSSGPYGEDDPTNPINEYGRQKVALERLARSTARHLICRTSGVFGWERGGKNFVCQLVRHLRAGREFAVPSDQAITPTYAPDLATAVVRLLDEGRTGTFHVVGPQVLRRPEFASLVADAFSLPAPLIVPRPTTELGLTAPRPTNAGLRDDKLRAVLGGPLRAVSDALAQMRATEDAGYP